MQTVGEEEVLQDVPDGSSFGSGALPWGDSFLQETIRESASDRFISSVCLSRRKP